MNSSEPPAELAQGLVWELNAYVDRVVQANGGSSEAKKPAHRVKFHWPPHPVSYSFHVLASDWTGTSHFEAHGERFEVRIARTPYGVFGRCEEIWLEERGETEAEMLRNLRAAAVPLFHRQLAIHRSIEKSGRFTGHVRDLPPIDLLKLLYCEDRDVANEARTEIEKHASSDLFLPSLLFILRDKRHPHRRSAQWCVLDLFEDLPSYCRDEGEELEAIEAMCDLIWSAEDDYARAVFKAGVVLGGHIPHKHGGPVLIQCLRAPSRIGRRSAIHGLYHVVEWIPEMREEVVSALMEVAESDPEPVLRDFARGMARDIQAETDHLPEPMFEGEA